MRAALDDSASCRRHFSALRWRDFSRDVAWMRGRLPPARWKTIFTDHGYNATPAWGILAGALADTGPISSGQLRLLTLRDPVLLLAMWGTFVWAFGWRAACVGLVFWGTDHFAPFAWTGGGRGRVGRVRHGGCTDRIGRRPREDDMKTIALEFVPPAVEDGAESAIEEAEKASAIARECGMDGRIRHLMIPGMVEEDTDRPIAMKARMEPLETWRAIAGTLPSTSCLCTQVTAFSSEAQLAERFRELVAAGVDGILFVGVPRTMADGEGGGVAPTDALDLFRDLVPNRGAILIPTRSEEWGRFEFKCERGATFALTQLLYSDRIVDFLNEFARRTHHRPEILLSFGYVPKVESRVNLIRWLIQDSGNPLVDVEQRFIAELAEAAFAQKKRALLDHYMRVVDGVRECGFAPGVHFETPYGFSGPAFEVFAEMLEYWAPDLD